MLHLRCLAGFQIRFWLIFILIIFTELSFPVVVGSLAMINNGQGTYHKFLNDNDEAGISFGIGI